MFSLLKINLKKITGLSLKGFYGMLWNFLIKYLVIPISDGRMERQTDLRRNISNIEVILKHIKFSRVDYQHHMMPQMREKARDPFLIL